MDVSGQNNVSGNVYATGARTNTKANAFIDFDFGSITTLGGFVFYQRGNNTDTVFSFDLIFSNNSDFSTIISSLTFGTSGVNDFVLKGDNDVDVIPDHQEFSFASAVKTRYVKWDVKSSQTIYDGAAEMEFWKAVEVPEPSSLAIFALGLIGLVSRRFKQQS